MIAAKPNLFHVALPVRRAIPHHRCVSRTAFIFGEGMKTVAYMGTKRVAVKGMLCLPPTPNNWQPQAQRFDGVPDSNRFDLHAFVAIELAKRLCGIAFGTCAIVPVRLFNDTFGCAIVAH